jgi:hypothetical protein
MPLLTTQSAKGYGFGSLVAPSISTSYVSLGSVKLASNQTSVTFSSIPATYKHLEFRLFQRKSGGGNDAMLMHLNGDFTNGNYAYYSFLGDGTSGVQSIVDNSAIGSTRSNGWNTTVITIPDYASTAKTKTYQALSGSSSQTESCIFYVGTVWDNTSAVNTIRLTVGDGNPFITGSTFALYGIKG